MAVQSIGYLPNLTVDALMKSFEKHFGDRYDVYVPAPADLPPIGKTDFVIRKTDVTSIHVHLKQEKSSTKIIYRGTWAKEPPFAWFVPYRMVLLLKTIISSKPMMDEVRGFVATSLRTDLEAAVKEPPEDRA